MHRIGSPSAANEIAAVDEAALDTSAAGDLAASAVTGPDGAYTLDTVVPGNAAVHFSRAGYRASTAEATPGASEVVVLDVGLVELSGTIAGTVSLTGGGGGGATVRAKLGEVTASTTWTDAEGRYALTGVDQDLSYSVYAWREGYYPDSTNPLLGVPAGTSDADFAMLVSTGRIAGRVLDGADSTALAGVAVTASDGLGHFGASATDEDGTFAIEL